MVLRMLFASYRSCWLLLSMVALYSHPALAEVSDKEVASSLFWSIGLVAALLCLVTARVRPWLGAISFAPALLWFGSLLFELHSPDVGPHLLREQGITYYLQAYAALGLVLLGLLLGCLWHKLRRS